MTHIKPTDDYKSKRRMGHASIVRGNQLIITGGNNGFNLADMLSVNIETLDSNDINSREMCKGLLRNRLLPLIFAALQELIIFMRNSEFMKEVLTS